jgi:hypothetical protein
VRYERRSLHDEASRPTRGCPTDVQTTDNQSITSQTPRVISCYHSDGRARRLKTISPYERAKRSARSGRPDPRSARHIRKRPSWRPLPPQTLASHLLPPPPPLPRLRRVAGSYCGRRTAAASRLLGHPASPASPHLRCKTKPSTRGGHAEGRALASGGEERPPVTAAPIRGKASDMPGLAGELLSCSETDPSASVASG